MQWVSFAHDGRAGLGAVLDDGNIVDLHGAARLAGVAAPADMPALIRLPPAESAYVQTLIRDAPPQARLDRAHVTMSPPVPCPGKIVCLAGNYREHILESGFSACAADDVITPQMFLKPATCLTGDGAEIPLARRNVTVGWEVELAVVIGAGGHDIPESDAMGHVFGYTILNDLSERAVNAGIPGRRVRERDPFFDWLAGKWFDGFAPCGPWIVPADQIADPHALDLRLRVNGAVRQEGNTRAMIFSIPRLIAEISSIMTLEPGDMIATGTPAGAGTGFGDAFLREGDEVVCEIDGIGTLRNRVGRHA